MDARTQIESLPDAALHAESVLLGLCLIEPERFGEIDLSVSDFGSGNHREIYAALNSLHSEGETWDSITVTEYLRKSGRLEAAGGVAFIADITSGIPRHTATGSHVQTVREASLRRRTAGALDKARERVYDRAERPDTLLGDVLADLQQLSNGYDDQGNLLPYSPNDGKAGRCPELICLTDVNPLEVEWLWEPYLPAGMLSMLSGDPGGGKTFISLAIAAALSKGQTPYTGEPCKPVNTVYLSLENSPEYVVRPRFDLLQGDPARLHILAGTITGKGKNVQRGSISLKDVAQLEMALTNTRAGLLIVDPIQSYLGADVDSHRSNETRPVLDGLARLASEHKCCVLMVRHLSKNSGGRAIHRGLGSIDITGAVRTELMAGATADDAQRRALVQVKSNLELVA
jgi:hypothetical protein